MGVLIVLGGVALVVGLVGVFLRLFPGADADQRPQHGGSDGGVGGDGGFGGGGGVGGGGGC